MSFDRDLSESERRLAKGEHDSFLCNLGDRLTAIRLPPCPSLTENNSARLDLEHGVYFCSGFSKYSFSGHVDSKECIEEKEIVDFVRSSHPELYKKLDKMALESGHVDEDSKDDRGAIDDGCELSRGTSPETMSIVAVTEDGVILPANEVQPMDGDCPSEPDHAARAQELLSAINAQLPVYLHCQPGVVFCCGAASCGFLGNVIAEGSFFTLANGAYYCLDCARKL